MIKHVLIVIGLSGAGKSALAERLEALNWKKFIFSAQIVKTGAESHINPFIREQELMVGKYRLPLISITDCTPAEAKMLQQRFREENNLPETISHRFLQMAPWVKDQYYRDAIDQYQRSARAKHGADFFSLKMWESVQRCSSDRIIIDGGRLPADFTRTLGCDSLDGTIPFMRLSGDIAYSFKVVHITATDEERALRGIHARPEENAGTPEYILMHDVLPKLQAAAETEGAFLRVHNKNLPDPIEREQRLTLLTSRVHCFAKGN